MIVITHYQRLLDYIVPDRVHVLSKGRIAHSGGPELALELEARGYEWIGKQPPGADTRSAVPAAARPSLPGAGAA